MKNLKIAKYQVVECLPTIRNYYIIFTSIIVFLSFLNTRLGSEGNFSSSGLELSTVIFLFIVGLNYFKGSFWFSQANNISRKTFFEGMMLGILPITFAMSIIDIVINRAYNIFVSSPTNFDMIYSKFREYGFGNETARWSQLNDLETLFGTFLWQFSLYSMVFIIGIFITLLYYKSTKLMKIVISIIPVVLLVFSNDIYKLFPISFWHTIGNFAVNAFGWSNRNPYAAVLSFAILGALFAGLSYLLIRKAVVKQS